MAGEVEEEAEARWERAADENTRFRGDKSKGSAAEGVGTS